MKFNKIGYVALAVALLGASCDKNYYDDNNFPGYKEGGKIVDVKTIEYTLTDNDYATIASNSTNKALAEEKGLSQELADVKKTHTLTDLITPDDFLPAFISSTWATADDLSVALITYNKATALPEEISKVQNATKYVLTKDDYIAIWDSETDYVENLTPNTVSKLTKVVPTDALEAGANVIVEYKYSEQEPSFSSEEPKPAYELSAVLGVAALDETVEVVARIVALSAQGPIIADKTGLILLYKGTGSLGDVVSVKGKISSYNFGFQLAAQSCEIETLATGTEVEHPAPTLIDGKMADNILLRDRNEYAKFVKLVGTPVQSGSYCNFNFDDAQTAQGSFYGITDEIKSKVTWGTPCTVYGYLCSVSKSGGAPKFVNFVATHVEAEPKLNKFTYVLGNTASGENVTATAFVSALSAQGPIITDNSGSILLYKGSGLNLYDVVTVTGAVSAYNFGLQINATSSAVEIIGTTECQDPVAYKMNGADLDECLTIASNFNAKYVEVEGTIVVSGNYYNFNVDGATTAQGSFYGITDELKAVVTDGMRALLRGYFTSVSKSGGAPKFVNMVVDTVIPANAPAYVPSTLSVVVPKSVKKYAVYEFDGTKLADPKYAVVQPSDYTEMGQQYENLSEPDTYLPKFLGKTYPYAEKDAEAIVAYIAYSGSAFWTADHYVYDGMVWNKDNGITPKTDQFRRDGGVWKIDHTLELDYSVMGTAEFKAFCQYCCNWVYDNIDVAKYNATPRDNAGVILSTDAVKVNGGSPTDYTFVSNYGNNEWYAGSYAYYGEMNWSGSKAAASWAEAGFDLSEDEIVEQMKKNSAEVFQNVLHYMYPDSGPEQYAKVVIKVYDYVSSAVWSFSFNVTGVGQFEYIEDSLTKL